MTHRGPFQLLPFCDSVISGLQPRACGCYVMATTRGRRTRASVLRCVPAVVDFSEEEDPQAPTRRLTATQPEASSLPCGAHGGSRLDAARRASIGWRAWKGAEAFVMVQNSKN